MRLKNVQKQKSLLDMNNDAVHERFNYEYQKVIENIKDPNTDPGKARKVIVEFSFSADDSRKNIFTKINVKSKLEPTHSIAMNLFDTMIEDVETGEMVHVQAETTNVIPGQINLDGEIHLPNVYVLDTDVKRS